MRRTALVLGPLVVLLAGCGGGDQPGNPKVYDRIASLTDCAALQQEFDTAAASHDRAAAGSDQAEAATSYMEAADDRLKELNCY